MKPLPLRQWGGRTGAPLVSVIVPAWNVGQYLAETIDSLLGQTYPNFEILVIDDASTDDTYEVAARYQDSRITVIRHDRNLGVAAARNTGIERARGQYIALLDGDDVACPKRLALQLAALHEHPSLLMVGSYVSLMTEGGERLTGVWRRPVTPEETAIGLIFRNTLSAVTMIRRDAIPDGGYRPLRVSEDYDLNMRIALRGQVSNLGLPLTWVRIRRGGLTGQLSELMVDVDKQIAKEYLRHLEIDPSDRELHVNSHVGKLHLEPSRVLLEEVEAWLVKLAAANDCLHKHDQSIFWRSCGKEWFEVSKAATPLGLYALKKFQQSKLSKGLWPGASEYLSFVVKSALKHQRAR